MAKRRKTRAQKKLSDFRHNFSHTISSTINQSISMPALKFQKEIKINSSISDSKNSHPYLIKDLSKTGILTLSILAAQIILYLLLTNHLFKIPGLNY